MIAIVISGFNARGASRWQALQQCPTPRLTEPGGSEYKFDLDHKNHIHILRHIASLCTAEASTTCSGYSFWKTFIKLPLPKDHVMFFSQGAIFSATAEQIRKRPLEDYQRYLLVLSTGMSSTGRRRTCPTRTCLSLEESNSLKTGGSCHR